jgi:hypothetical protein
VTPVKATKVVTQTLTCDIGDVTKDVTVTWKDKDNNPITNGAGGYAIEQGSVHSNVQKSTLKIESGTLSILSTPVTYKCAAQSKQYPDSEISGDKDIVVNFLTLGKLLHIKL